MDGVDPISSLGLSMADYSSGLNLPSAVESLQSNPVPGGEEQKKQIAKDFESVLLTKLFDEVKESIGRVSLDEEEDGASDQVYGLFWLYLAQDVANKGGFGLWKDIYRHFRDLGSADVAAESISREL